MKKYFLKEINMKSKTIFISGAGSGFGKDASIKLANRKHKVIVGTQFEEQANRLNEIAKFENIDLEAIKQDILEDDDIKLIENYDIDVLILNAAIGESGSISEIPIEKIESEFRTNIYSNIKLTQVAIRKAINENKNLRIILISSLAGRITCPFISTYCASKSALESFFYALMWEMKLIKKPKIEVTIIEPGTYATGFNKENNEKKYEWMKKKSYFDIEKIRKTEDKIWRIIERKNFKTVIRKYVKAVETKHLAARYFTPLSQVLFIQILRIIGF